MVGNETQHENLQLAARREEVAAWIGGSLRPVAQLIEEGELDIKDEEITEEAKHFEVRNYQLDAWAALWKARQADKKSGLIHLATGLGKTSVAVFDVKKFREEHVAKYGSEPSILFACGQNDILEQAAERFAAFIPVASQGLYNKVSKNRDGEITFATLQSLYSSLDEFEPAEFDYIIYDEAHHTKADTFEAVVKHFKPMFQLALTATPDRLDELNIRELFGRELYSKGLAQALAEELLATPDYHIVIDDAVKNAMESEFEPETLKELNALFNSEPRNEVIAQNIRDEIKRIGLEFGSEKTIVFCRNIAHAREMAVLLGGEAYHSGIESRQKRKAILDKFRHGSLKVICTRDMFNEGIDIPDARLLVFLRSTSSQTIFEQQLGRGLRKHAGKERVSVLDFVANVERIAMIRELADNIGNYVQQQQYEPVEGTVYGKKADETQSSDELKMRTGHGNFDFEKLSIDLLERYNYIKEIRSRELAKLGNHKLVALALELKPHGPLQQREIGKLSNTGKFVSASTIIDRFGGIIAFQRACGFEVRDSTELSDQDLIDLALELKPDAPLTNPEIIELSKQGSFVSPSNIMKRFGGIIAFQRACGFEVINSRELSNQEVVDRALELKPVGPLDTDDIRELSKQGKFISPAAITRRFGGIIAFQRACGFEVLDYASLDAQTVIEMALELKPDGPLSEDEVSELSLQGKFISTRFIRDHFGSLRAFQRACGFDIPALPAELSNQELIEMAIGLKPKGYLEQREVGKLSKEGKFISVSSVTRRFGSFSAFQKACISAQQGK